MNNIFGWKYPIESQDDESDLVTLDIFKTLKYIWHEGLLAKLSCENLFPEFVTVFMGTSLQSE